MYDLIVIGAGPAGSAAAIVACLGGLRVGLLDDTDEQRLKVGEALPGAVVRLLRRLGLDGPGALLRPDELEPCVANVSAWGNEHWSYRNALSNPEGGGWHVFRHRFDASLRARAAALGVESIHARVGDVASSDRSWHVSVLGKHRLARPDLRARFLIDATGRRALICRKEGVGRRRLSEQFAAVGWMRHAENDLDRTTRVKSVADGWWYTARLPGALRVLAFHGLPRTVSQLVNQPETFVRHCNATDLLPDEVRASALVEPLRATDAAVQCAENVIGPGWLAAGDAALSFDPLSSQGVLFALYSGIHGAETVIQCLATAALAPTYLGEYERKVRDVLIANQRARRLFYTSERRYLDNPYWQNQQKGLSTDCAADMLPGMY